jgi:DNA polymerase-3 subunit gamma/tau
MAYQVLARKYRPQRFSDVVGQEHVTRTLAQAIQQNRIAHAYIFCGPRGTGKTTIARIFAKCLNCTDGPKVDFREDDPRVVEITEGRSMDVLEIDGASNNSVEQVRDLRETVKYAPAASRFKIYIIDEVHMLSTSAFNALLKTLEEPPPHVKFFFATTDPEKVLPTILSRCQRFDLRRIPSMLIVQQLARIAKAEGVEVEEAALQAIARGCDGGMRDMYGLAAQSQLLSMAGAILAGDAVQAMRELDAAAQAGKDLARLVGDLLRHFRNLLIYQVSQGDRSLLEVSEAEWEAMKPQLAGVTTETLTRIMEVLSECELQLREAASRKILIELALWKACQARQAVSLEAVLQQLQRLRTEAAAGGASEAPAAAAAPPAGSLRAAVEAQTGRASRPAPAAAPANPPSGAPPPQARAANEPVAETALQELWGRLLAEMREQRPMLYSTFALAFPVSFERGDLVIGFAPDNKANMVLASGDAHRAWLVQRLAALGWPDVRLKFVEASPPAAPAPAVTASAPAEAGASAAAPAAAP